MHTHCPGKTKLLIAYKALSGSPPLTWSLDTGRSKWMQESKPLTAFTVGPFGFYEYAKECLFRPTNTPATFQRLMETCLGYLNLHWWIIYLDDIVIFSMDLASHLERLEAVFPKLEEAGLRLKPSKCELIWWQLAYLGHVISAQGVATDEGKIEAIKNWPTPTNITEVQKFFGVHGILPQVYPLIHAGSMTSAWINIRWECWQEEGCH